MPFVASKAIILAAGRGERLAPLTDRIPKPLLGFNGTPIIENIILRLIRAGIKSIIVVVGYKVEQFAYLPAKFPSVQLNYNQRWNDGNNILSVHSVIEHCQNALIVNGDAIITEDVLKSTYDSTSMYADRSRGFSKEWELLLDNHGKVAGVNLQGGTNILQQREVTFICASDFARFRHEVCSRVAAKSGLSDYFEFCLLPWCSIAVCEVPYGSIFDLDSYHEWMNHPLTDKSV